MKKSTSNKFIKITVKDFDKTVNELNQELSKLPISCDEIYKNTQDILEGLKNACKLIKS